MSSEGKGGDFVSHVKENEVEEIGRSTSSLGLGADKVRSGDLAVAQNQSLVPRRHITNSPGRCTALQVTWQFQGLPPLTEDIPTFQNTEPLYGRRFFSIEAFIKRIDIATSMMWWTDSMKIIVAKQRIGGGAKLVVIDDQEYSSIRTWPAFKDYLRRKFSLAPEHLLPYLYSYKPTRGKQESHYDFYLRISREVNDFLLGNVSLEGLKESWIRTQMAKTLPCTVLNILFQSIPLKMSMDRIRTMLSVIAHREEDARKKERQEGPGKGRDSDKGKGVATVLPYSLNKCRRAHCRPERNPPKKKHGRNTPYYNYKQKGHIAKNYPQLKMLGSNSTSSRLQRGQTAIRSPAILPAAVIRVSTSTPTIEIPDGAGASAGPRADTACQRNTWTTPSLGSSPAKI